MSENDLQLFQYLALKHMDDLYSKAIRMARNAERAEDLVQRTFATAYNVFEEFDKNSDFNKWLDEILMVVYTQLSQK